ncbi:MAG: hypothetical protein RL339_705, partial [Pseudomonadota bacterium]
LTLQDFDDLAGDVPLLANIMPSGAYLMEDLHYAGGMPALMQALDGLLHLDVETVGGQTLGEQIAGAEIYNPDVIATLDNPFKQLSGIWVLRGNVAPDGAIIKPSAASPNLLQHRGKAVVFETIEDFKARIDDPDLEVDANSVLVLKGCGPKGYPGMPEVGNMPLPQKLLAQGVTDMVRISDARMSGTAFGTVVLHTSPETSIGGPLGLVETGDEIELDAAARTINVLVSEAELARRAALRPPEEFDTTRGYVALHRRHVLQAHVGADLDFLVGKSGDEVKRESH